VLKKIRVEDAEGTKLAHDVTEIRPGEFKGPAFRKGHEVCNEDICRLQRLGKNHLYLIDLEEDEVHENQAASILAGALAGEGIEWEDSPKEGKIGLRAAVDGLLKVDVAALAAFNMVDEVMCATLHSNTLVRRGELVAATRAIPLVMERVSIERAAVIAGQNGGVVSVKTLRKTAVGLVVTGDEVYKGLVEDRFAPILTAKIRALGSDVTGVVFAPDDTKLISEAVRGLIETGCELILLSGGMSVDPDDVTRRAVREAGADVLHYGAGVLPGAMFLAAYIGHIPLLGVPACGLHHRITVLDLLLPRVLAFLSHGGLCKDCLDCTYPHCPFGKGN